MGARDLMMSPRIENEMLAADKIGMRDIHQVSQPAYQQFLMMVKLVIRIGDLPKAAHQALFLLRREIAIDQGNLLVQ